jgi:hypothetical protein
MAARHPAALTLALTLAAGGCAGREAWPRQMTTTALQARPTTRGSWIVDYDTALVSIARVMDEDLHLPIVPVNLRFYHDRDAFRAALEADGYDGDLAVDAASSMTAITGHRRVLLNDAELRGLEWPFRIALLAHELAHTVQYELAGGRRGASEQWLREGFAEWVEVQVLTALGFTTPAAARRIAEDRVRRAGELPSLLAMSTFPEWVRAGLDAGTDGIYAQAWLAAGVLVERHGTPAVLEYFRSFERSDDRFGNFARAFGQDLRAFDEAFRAGSAGSAR